MSKKKHKSLNKKYAKEILEECHTVPTQRAKENSKKLMKYFDEFDDNDDDERPCSVAESIEESLKQIKEYKAGKREFKSLEESNQLWIKLLKELDKELDVDGK